MLQRAPMYARVSFMISGLSLRLKPKPKQGNADHLVVYISRRHANTIVKHQEHYCQMIEYWLIRRQPADFKAWT